MRMLTAQMTSCNNENVNSRVSISSNAVTIDQVEPDKLNFNPNCNFQRQVSWQLNFALNLLKIAFN